MNRKFDLYDSTYGNFETELYARIRRRTFGEDLGQNSWTTADEYRRWAEWLALGANSYALEVASGSGGPALFLARLTGSRVVGVDINPHGVADAVARAEKEGLAGRVRFEVLDADAPLPFADRTFDAILCVDAANHFVDRRRVLADWRRILRPGGRLIFTDPVVVTGLVSSEELAGRSSIGPFLFAPPGVNERFLEAAGLMLVQTEDGTANAAVVAKRWHDAREREAAALLPIEGEERHRGLQDFFAAVHRLTSERRLSRIVYFAKRPASDDGRTAS